MTRDRSPGPMRNLDTPNRAWPTVRLRRVVVLALLLAPLAGAQQLHLEETELPIPIANAGAAFDGRFVHLFGGTGCAQYCDQIQRFDPFTGAIHTADARLPTPRSYFPAVHANGYTYLFGGVDNDTFLGEILRFDPATERLTRLAARLPPIAYSSAVWTGEDVYLFGGCTLVRSAAIYRFTPGPDTVERISQDLPEPRCGTSAVWDDESGTAYIFGGRTDAARSTDIIAFTPGPDGGVEKLPIGMTASRSSPAAFWDGQYAWILGGADDSGTKRSIDRFDPTNFTVREMEARLPSPRWEVPAVWTGSSAHLFGGFLDARWNFLLRQIVTVTPPLPDGSVPPRPDPTEPPEPRDPTAWFGYTVNGTTVSVNGSWSHDDGPLRHQWDWGDGSPFDEGAVATHGFAPGKYTVLLRVIDQDGLEATFTRTITIGGQDVEPPAPGPDPTPKPLARFTYQVDGLRVAVDAGTSTSHAGDLAYRWTWGDGSLSSNGVVSSYVFPEPASYRITLTVMDDLGRVNNTSSVVTVQETPEQDDPGPGFNVPVNRTTLLVAGGVVVVVWIAWTGYRRGYW